MQKLIIVESPTKAKKIQSFFSPQEEIKVLASNGHLCDLTKKTIGFNLNTLEAEWQNYDEKKKHIQFLKSQAKGKKVILATDLDREGEAIAWHLKRILNLKNPDRVGFREITKSSVLKAIDKPSKIDNPLVNAYIARRLLDRYIGWTVSPKLGDGLSAGRVQSVALKICDMREQQILNFTPRNYFEVTATINGIDFTLETDKLVNDDKLIFDESIADFIIDSVKNLTIHSVEKKEANVQPRPPFITSTLQQTCSSVLNISPDETASTCQKLFEAGMITYHRTDNPNYSKEGFELLASIAEAENIITRSEQIKRKSKDAQEAHEAIRITSNELSADQLVLLESSNIKKVYDLIKERSLTSISIDGKDATTAINAISETLLLSEQKKILKFVWKGREVIEPGWRTFSKIETFTTSKKGSSSLKNPIEEETNYSVELTKSQKKTRPPERFTEATLIKSLVKLGIGRPSTYASIITNIKSREYIQVKNRLVTTQKIGNEIVEALNHMAFMRFDFTKTIENELDDIASGNQDYKTLLKDFIQIVKNESDTIEPKITKAGLTSTSCPHCQQSIKQMKKNKNVFWVHLTENDQCLKFINDNDGKPSSFISQTIDCPRCETKIQSKEKKDKSGSFWVHTDNNHDCLDFIQDNEGEPVIPNTGKCPDCQSLVIKREKYSKELKKPVEFFVHASEKNSCSTRYLTPDQIK